MMLKMIFLNESSSTCNSFIFCLLLQKEETVKVVLFWFDVIFSSTFCIIMLKFSELYLTSALLFKKW